MRLKELNVKQRIILSLMTLMLLTVVTAALASLGFLQAQNRIDHIGNVRLQKLKAVTDLVVDVRELEAKIRFLEGKRKTYEMDSVSYEVLQLVFTLEESIKQLRNVGFELSVIDTLEAQLGMLAEAVNVTNRHLRRGQQMQQNHEFILQRVSNLQVRNKTLIDPLSKDVTDEISDIVLALKTALASTNQKQVRGLKKDVEKRVNDLFKRETLSSIEQSLLVDVRDVSFAEDGVFALRFTRLTHEFAFESTVDMNIARLAPLLKYSMTLFEQESTGIESSIDEQESRLMIYLAVFAAIVLISFMVGLSLMENLKSHVIDRLLRLRKNMHRFVAGERDAKELALDEIASEDDEIRDMSNDLASVVETVNRRSNELEALSRIGRAMAQVKSREGIIEQLKNNMATFLPVDAVVLATWERSNGEFDFPLTMSNVSTSEADLLQQTELLIVQLGMKKQEIRISNPKELAHLINQDEDSMATSNVASLAYYPLLDSHQHFIGALVVSSARQDAFSPNRLKALQTLSRYVAIALEYTATLRQLQEVESKLLLQERWVGMGSWDEQTGRQLVSIAKEMKFTCMSIKQRYHSLCEWLLAQPSMADTTIRDELKAKFTDVYNDVETAEQDSRRLHKQLEALQKSVNDNEEDEVVDLHSVLLSSVQLVRQKFPDIEIQKVPDFSFTLVCQPQRSTKALMDVLLNVCLALQKDTSENTAKQVDFIIEQTDRQFTLSINHNGLRLTPSQAERLLYEQDLPELGVVGLVSSKQWVEDHEGVLTINIAQSMGYRVDILFAL